MAFLKNLELEFRSLKSCLTPTGSTIYFLNVSERVEDQIFFIFLTLSLTQFYISYLIILFEIKVMHTTV